MLVMTIPVSILWSMYKHFTYFEMVPNFCEVFWTYIFYDISCNESAISACNFWISMWIIQVAGLQACIFVLLTVCFVCI